MEKDNFTIIVDTREQTPLSFGEHPVVRDNLATGDYSMVDFTDLVSIERKSLPDLVACVGRERERFERELKRLEAYRFRAVLIESTLMRIHKGNWKGKIKPNHVLGSIASWAINKKIDFLFCDNPELASDMCFRLLSKSYNSCYKFGKRFI